MVSEDFNLPAGSERVADSSLDDALCQAVSDGRSDIVSRLLEDGANPNAYAGRPLWMALQKKNHLIVTMLLLAGSDPDSEGYPLLDAVLSEDAMGVRIMLAAGADVRVKDNEALFMAAKNNLDEICGMLLEADADAHNERAFQTASRRGHMKIVNRLNAARATQRAHEADEAAGVAPRRADLAERLAANDAQRDFLTQFAKAVKARRNTVEADINGKTAAMRPALLP